MSQPAVTLAPLPFDFEIVTDDGEPVETAWHYLQMSFLYELLRQVRTEQGRTDVYFGANQFVYYSIEQARHIAQERRPKFRGPDVYWVAGVDPHKDRECWIAWEEDGRLPDVIFELMSKSNRRSHRREKKELYGTVWQTPEYFVYSPRTRELEGYRLAASTYRPIAPDAQGRLWSQELGHSIGVWHGPYGDREDDWIRLYRPDGSLLPTPAEAEQRRAESERQRAESERQRAEAERRQAEAERQQAEAERQRAEAEHRRAEAERQRAEAAEAELARLRALLGEQGRS